MNLKSGVFVQFYLFLCSIQTVLSALNSTVDIQTQLGIVQGLNISQNGQTIIKFRKVPFAKPPINNLRFQKPQPINPWTETLIATQPGPVCPQKLSERYERLLENKDVSEDCLHLNIYIPHSIDRRKPKAVMVYIHGGGFYQKAGTLYDGSGLALHGDVIVVLINYRLGMFGFMSTEDDVAKGNYGLWDQIQALKWIQEHISDFGGDPKKVTVFGHSAGGYSIGLLTLSPVSSGLFQRAICMSGFGTSERAITHGARNATIRLARILKCVNDSVDYKEINTNKAVDCIKNKSMSEIVQATNTIQAENSKALSFIMTPAPVVDKEIILDFPKLLLANTSSESFMRFKSLDYMAGTVDSDGGLLYARIKSDKRFANYSSDGITSAAFCNIVIPRLTADYFERNVNVSEAICNKYKDETNFINQGLRSVEMYGDMMYASEGERTLQSHSKLSSRGSYQFLFTHKPTFPILTNLPRWFKGAYHGDEVPFIFRRPVYDYSEDEVEFSQNIMTYWTNFAKFGNPNGNGSETVSSQPYWSEFDIENGNYMNFNINTTADQHLYRNRIHFWLNTVPNILLSKTKSHDGVSSFGITPMPDLLTSTLTICCLLIIR